MARERRREPLNCATAFTKKLKTTHPLCVCSYTYHVSYTFAFKKKKEPESVIRGYFFLVIIPRDKAVVRTNKGMDDCGAGGISQHSVLYLVAVTRRVNFLEAEQRNFNL